jgi:Flp pilus assembly pilin Flp
MNMIMNFLKDEEGAIMAEYGLLLVLIAIVLITAIVAFRGAIATAFNRATSELSAS